MSSVPKILMRKTFPPAGASAALRLAFIFDHARLRKTARHIGKRLNRAMVSVAVVQ
jgi:hypothetical protein